MLIKRLVQREHKLKEQMKITALNELKVKNLNHELAIKYQLADLNARLEERENIARNIHNVVGHTITSAIVSLQAYRALQATEPQRAEEKLTAATERMRLSLEEIRRAVRVLDQETQEISLQDFKQLLIVELNRFSMDTEIKVSHNLNHLEKEQVMDKRYCEFLHSALTECLNNGIRHGNASEFFVFLQCEADWIQLSVSDNGSGFEQLPKAEQERRIKQGYGIRKMEQFVIEHGGKLKISSENGFRVNLELPLLHL
jgi:signal transduction histidine kinase